MPGKILMSGFVVFLLLFSFSKSYVLASYSFFDDFEIENAQWEYISGSPDNTLNLSYARSYTVGPRNANFIELVNPVPDKPVSIVILFRNAGTHYTQGAGIAVNDTRINEMIQHPPGYNELLFNIWPQGNWSWGSTSSICLQSESNCNNVYRNIWVIDEQNSLMWQQYRIDYIDNRYYFYLNGTLKGISVETQRRPKYVWIGNPETTNVDQTFAEIQIDSIAINEIDKGLTFPHYSQLDPLWAEDEYDHAGNWAPTGEQEIKEWGCAVTSAAMILKNYDVGNPITGEVTTPQLLNDWLTAEPDGYVRNGLTNWLAIARYSYLAELSGNSPISLEYLRQPYDEENVRTQIGEEPSVPTVAKNTASHFLVIYGEKDGDWLISDPLATESGTLAKATPLVNTNTFIPSHTDLSYMMFVLEPEMIVKLYDAADNLLPIESALERLENGGNEVQIVYFRKPDNGIYRIEMENPSSRAGSAEMYFYNLVGEVEKEEYELGAGEKKSWQVVFTKDGETIARTTELDITPPEINWAQPTTGDWVSGDVSLQVSCNETCDYVNFWWRKENEAYSPASKRYHYLFDNGTIFSWTMDTNGVEKWDGTVYPLTDGNYYLYAAGKDLAGNWARTPEIMIKVDNTAPAQVTGMRVLDHTGADLGCDGATNNRRITVDWADNSETDFDHYLYDIKDKENFRSFTHSYNTGDIRNLDGEYRYRVKAVDLAGNVGRASEWCAVTLDRLAPDQPQAPWTNPNPTNSLLQSWLWGEANDNGSGTFGYYNQVYDVLNKTYVSDWLWLGKVLGTATELTDGEWQMVIRAEDAAGNKSGLSASEILLVDTQAPALVAKTSFGDDWYNTPQKVYFQYDDLHLLSDYSDPWCEIKTEASDAYCYVTPSVCDTAGNCNRAKVFSNTIGLDLTKPSVTLSEWGRRISGTASDALSGITRVEIRLTPPGESEAIFTAEGTTDWSYSIDPGPVGDYQVYVVAYDEAGNESNEAAKSFTISASEPPPVSPTPSPSASSEVLGETTSNESFAPETPTASFEAGANLPLRSSPSPEVLGISEDNGGKSIVAGWRWLAGIGAVIVVLAMWHLIRRFRALR